MLLQMIALVVGVSTSSERQADSVDVRHAVETVARAFQTNDPALLDRVTTADYTFVAPNGAIQTRAQRLAPMQSGQLRYTLARYDEIVVKVLGGAAVATARVTTQAMNGTADASGVFRATLVFVRSGGRWRMTASHASVLAQ